MVWAGGKAIELYIEQVREPGDGMPVCLPRRCERPRDGAPGEPSGKRRVGRHIPRIVEVYEIVARDRRIHSDGQPEQRQRDPDGVGWKRTDACWPNRVGPSAAGFYVRLLSRALLPASVTHCGP